jgi:hypothetical protein
MRLFLGSQCNKCGATVDHWELLYGRRASLSNRSRWWTFPPRYWYDRTKNHLKCLSDNDASRASVWILDPFERRDYDDASQRIHKVTLTAGDLVLAAPFVGCLHHREVCEVHVDDDRRRYVHCDVGRHYLDDFDRDGIYKMHDQFTKLPSDQLKVTRVPRDAK